MAANQVKFTLKFTDDGGIELVGKKADKAAKSMGKMSDATDQVNKRKRRYNKVEKGVAGATSNSTKAFTKQAGAIQGGLVPAYAILASNVFAVTAAFGVLQRSAALEQLEAGLVKVGNAAGRNLPLISRELQNITNFAISSETAMRATALATSSGFSSSQLMDLTRVAKGASLALGRNLPDALDRLVRGTAKLEPEILDELGILVRIDDATRDYAAELGKTANQLTAFQRQQAFLNATIEQGQKKFKLITKDIPVNEFDRLAATFSDASQALLKFVNDGLEPLVRILAESPASLMSLVGTIGAMGLSTMVTPLTEMASSSAEAAAYALDSMNKKSQSTQKTFKKMSKDMMTFDFMPPSAKALEKSFKSGSVSAEQLRKTTIATQGSVTKMGNTNKRMQEKLAELYKTDRSKRTKAQNNEVKSTLKALANRRKILNINKENLKVMRAMAATEAAGGMISAAAIAAGTGTNAAMIIRKEMMEAIANAGFFAGFTSIFKGFGNSIKEIFKGGIPLLARFGLLLSSVKTLALGLLGFLAKFAGPIGLAITATLILYNVFKEKLDPIISKVANMFGFLAPKAKTAAEEAASGFSSFTGIAIDLEQTLKDSTTEGEKFTSVLRVQVGLMDQLSLAIKKMNEANFDNTQKQISKAIKESIAATEKIMTVTQERDKVEEKIAAKEEKRQGVSNRRRMKQPMRYSTKNEEELSANLQETIEEQDEIVKNLRDTISDLTENALKITTAKATEFATILKAGVISAEVSASTAENEQVKDIFNKYKDSLDVLFDQITEQLPLDPGEVLKLEIDGKKVSVEYAQQLEKIIEDMGRTNRELLASIDAGPDLAANLKKSLVKLNEASKGPFEEIKQDFQAFTNEATNILASDDASAAAQEFLKGFVKTDALGKFKGVTGTLRALRREFDKPLDSPITKADLDLFTRFNEELGASIKKLDNLEKAFTDASARSKLLNDLAKEAPQLTKEALTQEQTAIDAKIALIDEELKIRGSIQDLTTVEDDKLEEIRKKNKEILKLTTERLELTNQQIDATEIGLKHDLAMLPVLKIQNNIAKETASLELQRAKTTALLLSTTGKLTTLQKNEFQLQAIQNTIAATIAENNLVTKRLGLEVDLLEIQLKRGVTDATELATIDEYLAKVRENIALEQDLLDLKLDQAKAAKEGAIVSQIASARSNIAARGAELFGVDVPGARDTAASNIAGVQAGVSAAQQAVNTDRAATTADIADQEKQGKRIMAMTQLNEAMRLQNTLTQGIVSGYGAAGEAMNQMTSAAEMLTMSLQSMAQTGPTLEGVGMAIAAIGQIAAGSAKQEVAAIDKQIKAEQKRDGKSKESLAKIRSLEKKKEAAERKAFDRKKKADMASIIIATARSVMDSFKNAGGFPLGMPMALAMGAIGAMQLSMVASQTFDGGGGGDPSVSAPSGITVGSRNNTVDLANANNASGEIAYARGESGIGTGMSNFRARPAYMGKRYRAVGGYTTGFMVGEQGPELFMPDTPGEIVAADETQNMMSGGTANVNFNISAIDAEGVEDVLLRQRGAIIGMIREAANGNGEFFLEGVE